MRKIQPLFLLLVFMLEPVFRIVEFFLNYFFDKNGTVFVRRIRGMFFAQFFECKNLHMGKNVTIERASKFKLENSVKLYEGSYFICGNEHGIEIGSRTHIGRNSLLSGSYGICIGRNCAISANVSIYSISNNFENPNILIVDQLPIRSKVVIGDNVLIGTGATILPGIKIGDHAVIGAGSVVVKDVNEYEIVAGVPARVINKRI